MKTRKLRNSVAIAAAVASCCAIASGFQSKYDRFENQTVVTWSKFSGTPTDGRTYRATQVLALFPGEVPLAAPDAIMVVFAYENLSWRYLQCHSVNYLADGKPIKSANTLHEGHVRSGYVDEQVKSLLTWQSAQALATASKIEVQVCADERALDADEIAGLKAVVEAITPKPK